MRPSEYLRIRGHMLECAADSVHDEGHIDRVLYLARPLLLKMLQE